MGHSVTGRHTYKRPGLPGCGLDARLKTLLCKNYHCKIKKSKTGCNLAESSKESYGSKRDVLPMMMMIKYNIIKSYNNFPNSDIPVSYMMVSGVT
jgi:hypothetical protein